MRTIQFELNPQGLSLPGGLRYTACACQLTPLTPYPQCPMLDPLETAAAVTPMTPSPFSTRTQEYFRGGGGARFAIFERKRKRGREAPERGEGLGGRCPPLPDEGAFAFF